MKKEEENKNNINAMETLLKELEEMYKLTEDQEKNVIAGNAGKTDDEQNVAGLPKNFLE